MRETWIVGHDFSPSSEAAALEAARLLAPMKGTLRLIHVHPIMQIPLEASWGEVTFELESDHIVVGSHGRTGIAHLVLGSVAEEVVREAKVPVLVVKGR